MKVEVNGAQMKILREFFDNYEDDKVKLTVLDDKNRIKTVYTAETELDAKALETHLKNGFKAHSKIASTLYYTVKVI